MSLTLILVRATPELGDDDAQHDEAVECNCELDALAVTLSYVERAQRGRAGVGAVVAVELEQHGETTELWRVGDSPATVRARMAQVWA